MSRYSQMVPIGSRRGAIATRVALKSAVAASDSSELTAVLRLLGRLGGVQRPCRRGVDALVPVVPADSIARRGCLTHDFLDDASSRRPLGRLGLDLHAISGLELHVLPPDFALQG